mmetsp:Transcript_39322/g.116510  ORF Transcript_39322/g.116510 Transcript_39322/m.116510 type:complete len:354 (+) Transcript_39322:23-1084(+)
MAPPLQRPVASGGRSAHLPTSRPRPERRHPERRHLQVVPGLDAARGVAVPAILAAAGPAAEGVLPAVARVALHGGHHRAEGPPPELRLAIAREGGQARGVAGGAEALVGLGLGPAAQGGDLVGDDRGARVQRRAVAQRADVHVVALVAREELHPGLADVALADGAEPDLARILRLDGVQHVVAAEALAPAHGLAPAPRREVREAGGLVLDVLEGGDALDGKVHVLGQQAEEEERLQRRQRRLDAHDGVERRLVPLPRGEALRVVPQSLHAGVGVRRHQQEETRDEREPRLVRPSPDAHVQVPAVVVEVLDALPARLAVLYARVQDVPRAFLAMPRLELGGPDRPPRLAVARVC